MRLKRGSKVEVMDKSGDQVSWRMAEILSVNGHTYDVEYDCYPGNATQPTAERVTRKFLRPCPPLVEGLENCTSGSIVEVFDDCSWKIAMILKVLNGDQYLVRLLGCSQELIINRSNARMRQTWYNDKWILMGQGSRGCDGDGKVSRLLTSEYYQKMRFQGPGVNAMDKNQAQKYGMHIQSDAGVRESHLVSSRSLKRMSPYCSSVIEANNGHVQKMRAIEKEETKNMVVSGPIIEKVDAVAYPREILGEKNMHASFNRSYGYNQMERPNQNDIYGYCGLRSSEFNNSDSDACSVGSCSVTSHSPNDRYSHIIPLPSQLTDTPGSDAESCYGPGSGCKGKNGLHLPKEEIEASIHRLELHAYHCTLEALYASGPLSWDKEALLTNLRIMLHISNDEHLMELKYLISTKTGTHVR
ncbi:Hypothetical predicted protein [Olea europaea subsp. europaea]|nr:Hypothetical predicted protein [Olea europaea subsp. europaea]